MKKLFIHIGTHKTGTSSIQSFFYKNQGTLKKEFKIHYLHYFEIPNQETLMKVVEVNWDIINTLKNFFSEKLSDKYANYFISWEGFSGDPDQLYSNTEDVLYNLSLALPKNIEIEIIVCFRRQDQFLQSLYNQKRHEGEFLSSIDFFCCKYNPDLDWLNFVNKIKKISNFNKIHVLPYDHVVLQKSSLINLIIQVLGLSPENLSFLSLPNSNIGVNVGFSDRAAKLYKELLPEVSSQNTGKHLRRLLQRIDNKGVFSEYNILSTTQINQILDTYNLSNSKLATEYWTKYSLSNFSNALPTSLKEGEAFDLEKKLILILLSELEEYRNKFQKNFFLRAAYKLGEVLNFKL